MNEIRVAELVRQAKAVIAELESELAGTVSRVHRYIDANYFRVEGAEVSLSDFYTGFRQWLTAPERAEWTKDRVIQEIAPLQIVNSGRHDQPVKRIRGLSLVPPQESTPEAPANADYDSTAMFKMIRELKKAGHGFDMIASKLNEQGYRDQYGRRWEWLEVRQVDAD